MKHHVVFAAVDHNLALITRETLEQRSGAFHRSEAAANNYDLGSIHCRPASANALDLLPCVSRRVPTLGVRSDRNSTKSERCQGIGLVLGAFITAVAARHCQY